MAPDVNLITGGVEVMKVTDDDQQFSGARQKNVGALVDGKKPEPPGYSRLFVGAHEADDDDIGLLFIGDKNVTILGE